MITSKVDNQQILTGEDYIEVQIEAFLNERKAQNLAKGTIQYYKDKLIPFMDYLNSIEIKFISQITPNNIRDYITQLFEQGHNEGGVHGYFRAIKAFLKWYWDEMDLETKNPIDKVKAPKVSVEPIEGINRENFDKLLNECTKNDFFGERDKTILMVLYETGVRASELCQINIDDVDLADSSILIRQGKGRKPRYVFFGKKTRKQLRKYFRYLPHSSGALFINRYEDCLVYGTLREILRRLSNRAKLDDVPSPHDFRRAFTLEQIRKGVDLLSLSRILGHTSLQLLSRYARQVKGDLGDKYQSVIDD